MESRSFMLMLWLERKTERRMVVTCWRRVFDRHAKSF